MQLDRSSPLILRGQAVYPDIPDGSPVLAHPGVFEILTASGLDPENPLSRWIQPGMTVLIKPNWVRHAADGWANLDCLVTHPSILRPVVEFAARSLSVGAGRYSGRIIVADAPLQSANFSLLRKQLGLPALEDHWKHLGLPVEIHDLRRMIAETDDDTGIVENTNTAPGDPNGDTIVDIGCNSRLEGFVHSSRFGVSNYDSRTTTAHHQPGRHCYRIANSLLASDVVINLPKWKTHLKTGITGALKNFIGINCDKAYLPHFRAGAPQRGGDEYPDDGMNQLFVRIRPLLEQVLPKDWIRRARQQVFGSRVNGMPIPVFGGAWPGNDTLWRTVHDVVWVARWMGTGGRKLVSPRPILSLLDGIVAGQADGPLRPQAAPLGCLLFGEDPGYVDVAASALSGLPWNKIPLLAHLLDPEAQSITSFNRTSPIPAVELAIEPPSTWSRTLKSGEFVDEAA
jgi:uncharacterized protein (DUF362 family)